MRCIVMVKATKDSESGVMPKQELLAEMGKFNEELVKSGVLLAAEGLQPSSKGKRVRFSGPTRTVGPSCPIPTETCAPADVVATGKIARHASAEII